MCRRKSTPVYCGQQNTGASHQSCCPNMNAGANMYSMGGAGYAGAYSHQPLYGNGFGKLIVNLTTVGDLRAWILPTRLIISLSLVGS